MSAPIEITEAQYEAAAKIARKKYRNRGPFNPTQYLVHRPNGRTFKVTSYYGRLEIR